MLPSCPNQIRFMLIRNPMDFFFCLNERMLCAEAEGVIIAVRPNGVRVEYLVAGMLPHSRFTP